MDVSLTPELEKLLSEKVKKGLYQSPSEMIREGLRLLEDGTASTRSGWRICVGRSRRASRVARACLGLKSFGSCAPKRGGVVDPRANERSRPVFP